MKQARGTGWQQVQDEVRRRIQTREWAPGDAIPNESDLAEELGCARATVNRALQALADDGLLERRRRAGTRVAPLPVRHARFRIPVLRQEIEATGARYGYRLLTREMKMPPVGLLPSEGISKEVLHLCALHLSDGESFAHEDRWINLAAIPAAAEVDFAQISANEWLVQNAPISDGEISFFAKACTVEEAALFGCDRADALFRAERKTWHDGQLITFVRQSFRPGYRMTTRI